MSTPIEESPLERDAVEARAYDDLGWVGNDPDDPEIVRLREYLAAHNGIRGLKITAPDEVVRATSLFHRDGFVVVRDVLTPEQLTFLRAGCERVVREMASLDGNRRGNRGSHRCPAPARVAATDEPGTHWRRVPRPCGCGRGDQHSAHIG